MFSLGIESIIAKLVQPGCPSDHTKPEQLKKEVEFSIQLDPKILKHYPIPLTGFSSRYVEMNI
jgi:hypothetical protein